MVLSILIVFFSLISLIILHELGHFLIARKFGVKVEEFGIFLPPRLWGKKIGETIYSINLIPFGAFVRVLGEDGENKEEKSNPKSFSAKPVGQRALIVLGGVLVFWIIAFILLSIVMFLGVEVPVSDDTEENLLNPQIKIIGLAKNSPAEKAGLIIGDTLLSFSLSQDAEKQKITKIGQFKELVEENKGKEIILEIKRGKNVFKTNLIPRENPPENEGPIGVIFGKVAEKKYPWYLAPLKGLEATIRTTISIIQALFFLLINLVAGKGLPYGAEIMGPIGLGDQLVKFTQLGTNTYLHFIAVLSIYLAIFNILPIPALDGGKIIFLAIEKIKGKAVSPKVEQTITSIFFGALLLLIFIVTIKDINRIFFN